MRNATQPRILLDTNILLAYINAHHPRHQAVLNRIEQLIGAGYELLLAPQCLYEFYVVATRPVDQNGLGLSPAEADQKLQDLTSVFSLREDKRSTVKKWRKLCQTYQISGKRAHDARLVAWMIKQGVAELLTLNAQDFQVFNSLIAVQAV